jgi:hypothetical protein
MAKVAQLIRNWILPDRSIVWFCIILLLMVWGGTLWQIDQDRTVTIETLMH